ncbi:hypothetical protein [Halobacterium sp. CBA1126]|nr:hypothetical protein [Halobacterium sp. CBA1126]MUV59529.1 hypothetical protein [Halobacterium sp. CBA1126]
MSEDELGEGYRRRADRAAALEAELAAVAAEATELLGAAPTWSTETE